MTSADRAGTVTVTRDCDGVLVPSGAPLVLHAGDVVVVVQRLGGAVTVRAEPGVLVRIGPGDSDALGLDLRQPATPAVPARDSVGTLDLAAVIEQLKGVFDPEIPVNVVDLGLIYSCDAQPLPGGGYRVEIAMSMTAPGCGMGDVLKEDARSRVSMLPAVEEVTVELVWNPPWTIDRMTDAARLELGLL